MNLPSVSHEAIAVTGLGMVTCQGAGCENSWAGIAASRDAATPWRHDLWLGKDAVRVAAAPPVACPEDMSAAFWQTLSRVQQMACVAVDEALLQAGLPHSLHDFDCGCFVSTSVCAMDCNERFYARYRQQPATAPLTPLKRVHPYELPHLLIKRHRITGPHYLNLTTCVGSAAAIGAAMDSIRSGLTSMAIVGGFDSLCGLLVSGFDALRLISPTTCRPFAPTRDGILPGEGGAVLVLESAQHAAHRGVTPLGFLRGFGASADAFHITKPQPEGRHAQRAVETALADAAMHLRQIDYVHSHGTGTRDNDAMEAALYQKLFAGAAPPLTSTKHLTGHTFAASGAIETAICLLAMGKGIYPPGPGPRMDSFTAGGTEQSPAKFNTALICNFAFGGNNTAIIASQLEALPS